jgi:hypothetical protein
MLQRANNEVMIMTSPPSVVRPDGTFAIENVSAGEYRLALSPMPPDAYVKSARLGNADVLQEGLLVSANLSGELEIVVSPNAGQLDGTVLDREQKPVQGVQVVLAAMIPGQVSSRWYRVERRSGSKDDHDHEVSINLDGVVGYGVHGDLHLVG